MARTLSPVLWTIAAVVNMPAARAQNAPVSADTGPVAQLEEVVVTATKRSERLLSVPESISAISGGTLAERQITTLDEVARSVPGVAITGYDRPGFGNYAIDGVSASAVTAGVTATQQTIGVYLDDVSLTMPTLSGQGAASPGFFDVARVEVLRGPQGTLYGAGSMGGTIRIISNQPDPTGWHGTYRGDVSVTDHGGVNYLAEGVANVPLVEDRLALRVGYQHSDDSGWIDRTDGRTGAVRANANSDKTDIAKIALSYRQSDLGLVVTPSFYYQDARTDGSPWFDPAPARPFTVVRWVAEPSQDRLIAPSLTASKDFGFATLTSATSYLDRRSTRQSDFSSNSSLSIPATLMLYFGAPTWSYGIPPIAGPTKMSIIQYSEELRLASPSMAESGKRFDWILGAYASRNTLSFDFRLNVQGDKSLIANEITQALGDPTFGGAIAGAMLDDPNGYYLGATQQLTKQYALFADGDYQLLKDVTATVGFRYQGARQTADSQQGGFYNFDPVTGAPGAVFNSSGKQSSNSFLPKVSLKYQPNPDTNVYATAVKGFRLGGINNPIAATPDCQAALAAIGRTKGDDNFAYEAAPPRRKMAADLSAS